MPTDRRAYALKATLAGRQLCQKAVKAVTTHEEQLLQGVDDAARACLIAAVRSIETGLGKG